MKIIETKIGTITLLDKGIIRVNGNSNVHITLNDMYENDMAFKRLLENGTALFLTIFGENATIEPDAAEYFANIERSKIKRAEALVTGQTYHKLSTLFHIKHLKSEHPIKQFQTELEAMEWLSSFILKANTH